MKRYAAALVFLLFLVFLLPACDTVQQNTTPESEGEFVETAIDEDVARTFYRYSIVGAEWDTQEKNFPAEWVSAAAAAIVEAENCEFTRGWLYDFDQDGNNEAILLFKWFGDYMFWDSSFVYVNSKGEAQFLTSGFDDSFDDQNKMDVFVLKYAGFEHILLRSGNRTAASGTWETIYRVKDGHLEELMSNTWAYIRSNGVFLETVGPQGMGPGFYFWDEVHDRYSAIGPVEISGEDFIDLFENGQINLQAQWDFAALDNLDYYNIDVYAYQVDQIEKVEVYGNRYYQIYFYEETYNNACGMAWVRQGDLWEIFWGPWGGLMDSPAFGIIGEKHLVYTVDMSDAEERAIPATE